jgi:hypothetical protein
MFFSCFSLLFSCKNSNDVSIPKDIISIEEMSKLIYESQITLYDSPYSQKQDIKKDSLSLNAYLSVLKAYNVDQKKFEKSLNFYLSNVDLADSLTVLIINKAK